MKIPKYVTKALSRNLPMSRIQIYYATLRDLRPTCHRREDLKGFNRPIIMNDSWAVNYLRHAPMEELEYLSENT